MTITSTEFKANFGKYIDMVAEEEFFIIKNGRIIAKVTNPKKGNSQENSERTNSDRKRKEI